MKRLSKALAILIILTLLSLRTGALVDHIAQRCTDRLTLAQTQAVQGNWTQARALTSQAFHTWEEQKFPLYVLMRHTELDEILLSFRAVEQYLSLEEMDQYTAANATLITQLELLAEMEQPSVENIL